MQESLHALSLNRWLMLAECTVSLEEGAKCTILRNTALMGTSPGLLFHMVGELFET